MFPRLIHVFQDHDNRWITSHHLSTRPMSTAQVTRRLRSCGHSKEVARISVSPRKFMPCHEVEPWRNFSYLRHTPRRCIYNGTKMLSLWLWKVIWVQTSSSMLEHVSWQGYIMACFFCRAYEDKRWHAPKRLGKSHRMFIEVRNGIQMFFCWYLYIEFI